MSANRNRPRVLSGIQPTADSFHFGNYLGALAQWVTMQDHHDAFYMVVDLHAITMGHDPAALRARTRIAAAQLLAIGLDPERCTLFVQSHVRQHAELAWVLSCITGYGEASRMTQFKDKSAKVGASNTTVGLFNYPVLMAGDILIYQADQVPVGEDQRQHLELSRTLAQRFNQRFGETFTVPEPYIVKETAKIYDLQQPTAKMSKSSSSPQGVLDLLEPVTALRKKIMRAVTDTGSEVRAAPDKPGITNLLTIMSAVTGDSTAQLEKRYAEAGYGTFKKEVADAVVEFVTPIQDRFAQWHDDKKALDAILERGALRASVVAEETMVRVRDGVGFLPAAPTVAAAAVGVDEGGTGVIPR